MEYVGTIFNESLCVTDEMRGVGERGNEKWEGIFTDDDKNNWNWTCIGEGNANGIWPNDEKIKYEYDNRVDLVYYVMMYNFSLNRLGLPAQWHMGIGFDIYHKLLDLYTLIQWLSYPEEYNGFDWIEHAVLLEDLTNWLMSNIFMFFSLV